MKKLNKQELALIIAFVLLGSMTMMIQSIGTMNINTESDQNHQGDQNDQNPMLSPDIFTQNSITDNMPNNIPTDLQPAVADLIDSEMNDTVMPTYPSDIDIGDVLNDRGTTDYNTIFEPWKSKAAIHAMAFDEDTGFLALAGGYLYDNEIHIYRMNVETNKFDKVWDSGDNIIQSDVMSVAFGDTDLNSFLEIVAGSSDGHIYVFEQRHLYDPFTNTENEFELVWTSPSFFRVFDVKVDDVDRDYRPDIIAGTWEGLHLFEYTNHSGYPFSEEHWIEYTEVWQSSNFAEDYPDQAQGKESKIYSLETGDTNQNGLPEIIVGTRDGTVYVFENDGLSVLINGQYFPLIRDNYYNLIWTSKNYTWTPILSMDAGELDGTPGEELAIVAQGQGLLILDWNEAQSIYDYQKVQREFLPWETFGYWGLDYYVDRVISANNVTFYDPVNVSLITPEPIQYVWVDPIFLPDADCYPYNTGMAGPSDGNYTTFDSSILGVDNATAIVDFGLDEEGTGSASSESDITIKFHYYLDSGVKNDFNFSISQDGTSFEQISPDNFKYTHNYLYIDVDSALGRRSWDWFRYAKISVFNNASFEINSLELAQVYNLLTDALSVKIGPLRTNGDNYFSETLESDKIIIGTVTGKFIAVEYETGPGTYHVVWDSGADERFTAGSGIWDMVHLPMESSSPNLPIWRMLYNPHPQFVPIHIEFTNSYNSWVFGNLDPTGFYDPYGSYLVGSKDGTINAFDIFGKADPDLDLQLDPINTYFGFSGDALSADIPYLKISNLSVLGMFPQIAVASFDSDALLVGNPLDDPRGRIDFFYREDNNLSSPFIGHRNMEEFDATGEITSLLAVAKAPPRIKFIDMDDDGDLDLVFTNGQLYYARNLYKEDGGGGAPLRFALIRDYFKDINKELTKGAWGQPDVFDLNKDGLLDLILNYDYKNGTTAFLNEGTLNDPQWVQEKRIFWNYDFDTNMKLWNLTDSRIIPIHSGNSLDFYADYFNFEMDADFVLVSMNPEYQNTYWYEPIYDAIDSYMVATYPTVSRIDFSLMKSTDNDFLNFGFNVEESWNTDEDLNDWTLSIASGDIDGDGKGEIVVGDYDNNVYIFENMVNNTYKRMYETFDLTHEEECTQSPYLYQELEGISGNFMRKIWDHAEHLLVDVDLDQDGLKEMIIATNLQIYVFEDKNLTGGDELQFIYSFDLRDSAFNGQQGWDEVNSISAMTFGKDLDYDGRLELIVAAGPFLWCFNVGEENYEGTEYNGFFITDPSLDGRYDLLGNPLADPDYQYAIINALISGDTDQDGWPEIILAGTLDSRAIKKDGFLFIYECEGGIFKKVWEAPDNVTHWNPITSIKIDDQDYDGAQEIIFGHSFGFDIWEWIQGSDSEYRQVEYVTASANYPNIPLSLRSMPVNFRKDYADMALGQGSMAKKVMHVYTNMSRISYAIYDETTQTWMEYGSVVPATYNNLGTIDYETTPSVCSASDGTFYAIWRVFPVSGNPSIYAAYYIPATQTWTTPVEQIFGAIFGYQDLYPDIAQYDSSNMVIIFTWDRGGGGISDLFYEVTAMNLPGTFTKSGEIKFDHFDEVHVQSSSIQRLSDGTFVIAFAAINNYLGKPDYDIWSIHLNATFSYENVAIHQITNSYEDELGPNLALLQSEDNSLVVTYENMQSVYEDRIGVCASKDYGRNWGRPHTLNDLGPNILRVEYPEYNYIRYEFGGGIVDPMPTIFGICIAGLSAEGFIYTFTYISRYWEYHIIDNPFWQGFQYVGINLQSDWTGNNLWNVEDLDVGDTDGDNRREIVAGWEDEVSVYELKSSNDGNQIMTYEETWLSDPLPNPFTAITVYDSNGNGFDEIGVATKHGNVYLMEYPDPSQGSNHLINGEERWNNSQTTYSSLFGLLSGDFDSDGKDEIISLGETPYEIIAFDDDGSILWNNSDNSYQWTWTGLHDLNNDSIPELIACDYDHSIFVFNTLTGTQLWNYSIPSIPNEHIDDFDVADIDNDGLVEVVCGSTNGSLWLFEANGTLIQQISGVASNGIIDIRLGDFYHNNETLVAFNDESGKLRVVYPLNGTIVYESPTFFITMWSTILNYDFNGDGIDELIFGYDKLHILDLVSGELIYNSSDLGGFMWFNMYLKDFDDDGNLEVLFLTTNNQVILEDLSSHQRQWTYSPTNGNIKDIEIGKLGGSGLWDVALVSSNGLITAINGKNGMPIWFTYEPEQVDSVVCADIDGLGHDSIVYWLHNSYKIAAWDGIVPTYISPSPKIVPRAYYYGIQTPSDVNGIWLQDIDNNKIDEIFYNVGDHHIYAWNVSLGNIIWDVEVEDPVSIKFGDLNGKGDLDLAINNGNEEVLLIDGDTGAMVKNILPDSGYAISDIIIRNFNSTNPNDEIALLLEKSSAPIECLIKWFSGNGEFLYKSDHAWDKTPSVMQYGDFTGNKNEIAISGEIDEVWIFNCEDGTRTAQINTPISPKEMLALDLNDDGTYELALLDDNYLRVYDVAHNNYLYVLYFAAQNVNGMIASRIGGDNTFKMVLNLKDQGVFAYDMSGTIVWSYEAPLLLSGDDMKILSTDFDGDGQRDIALVNYNYFEVIKGSNAELMFHYRASYPLKNCLLGSFLVNEPKGFLYTDKTAINLIVSTTTAPVPPSGENIIMEPESGIVIPLTSTFGSSSLIILLGGSALLLIFRKRKY